MFAFLHAYRDIVYVRIKSDWLSVRVVRDGKLIGQYEDIPQIAVREGKGSKGVVVGVGRAAEQAVRESPNVSLLRGFSHPRVVFGNYEETKRVLEQFVLRAFGGKRTLFSYRMLLHSFPPLEGGLSDVEERGLMELAREVGARYAMACLQSHELRDVALADILELAVAQREPMVNR